MSKGGVDEDQEEYYVDLDRQDTTTIAAGISFGLNDKGGGFLLWELGIMETLLIIVCGVCLFVLVISLAYFYIMHKLGRFSDNPVYKRRMYYAMTTSSTSGSGNPAQCFNVFKRDRPNTLSLTAAVSTPPTIIVPVPTMDVAVGDDRILNGGRKIKTAKGKLKSESMNKYRISASSSAVSSMAVPKERYAKKQHGKVTPSKYGIANVADDQSSDESGVYVTPPQDVGEVRGQRKEKRRAHKV